MCFKEAYQKRETPTHIKGDRTSHLSFLRLLVNLGGLRLQHAKGILSVTRRNTSALAFGLTRPLPVCRCPIDTSAVHICLSLIPQRQTDRWWRRTHVPATGQEVHRRPIVRGLGPRSGAGSRMCSPRRTAHCLLCNETCG